MIYFDEIMLQAELYSRIDDRPSVKNNAKENSLQTLNNLMSMRWFMETRALLRMA